MPWRLPGSEQKTLQFFLRLFLRPLVDLARPHYFPSTWHFPGVLLLNTTSRNHQSIKADGAAWERGLRWNRPFFWVPLCEHQSQLQMMIPTRAGGAGEQAIETRWDVCASEIRHKTSRDPWVVNLIETLKGNWSGHSVNPKGEVACWRFRQKASRRRQVNGAWSGGSISHWYGPKR